MDISEYWAGGALSKANYDVIARQKEYEIHEQELIENLENGISIGEQNGITKGINTMILNMIKNNIPLNDIATISGKSLSKIKKMASNIKQTNC